MVLGVVVAQGEPEELGGLVVRTESCRPLCCRDGMAAYGVGVPAPVGVVREPVVAGPAGGDQGGEGSRVQL